MTEGLRILESVKKITGLPIITDIHEQCQAEAVASVADIVQIPAFLCRQTDLLLAGNLVIIPAGRTGRIIHIKKGQFASPTAMREQALKIVDGTGNRMVMLCERGTTFGYEDLVVDPRSLVRMARDTGLPVVMDVTHALQRPSTRTGLVDICLATLEARLPGSEGGIVSGGDGSLVRELGDVAAACGVSGIFVEVHEDPSRARCDAQVQTPLERLEPLLVRWSHMARAQRSAPPA